jgi:Xaa-Pro aminopeptidase
MKTLGWDAYFLPMQDRFLQSSPLARATIQRLTGFTGSSGSLILTPESLFLCIDGRYTLQAQQETEGIILLSESPFTWLKTWGNANKTLAIDPWIVSKSQLEHMEKLFPGTLAFDEASTLRSMIYPSWNAVSLGAIQSIPSDRSFQEKCQEVFGEPLQHPILLCKGEDIAWITNLRGADMPFTPLFQAYALIHWKSGIFYADIFTALPRFLPKESPEFFFYDLKELEALKPMTLAYDPKTTPVALWGPSWIASSSPLAGVRAEKTSWEINHMAQAHERDGVALVQFLHWLSNLPPEHMESETSAAQYLEELRQKNPNYKGPSFPTLSSFGDHSAIIHYIPPLSGSRPLGTGLYLVDSGGQYYFGTTDVTRTLWLSPDAQAPSLKAQRLFTCVLQAHIHLASQIFPHGTSGQQLDAIARSFLWQRGLDYDHGTGHGVGTYLSVHESPPNLSQRAGTDPIKAGMIFSNEPGYYEEHWGGIRLENLVVVEPYGVKDQAFPDRLSLNTLTLAPFDLKLILTSELSWDQRNWLNTYHHRVYTTLAPFLPPLVRDWLFLQTRPLES